MSTPTGGQYGDDPTRQQQAGDQQYGQPQYGQQPYDAPNYGGAATPPPQPKNGLGTAALVLGIIGLILAITVVVFWLGAILGLLAIVFGIIGMGRAKKGLATNRGVAIGGLVTGILAVLIAIAIGVFGALFFTSIGGGDYLSCVQQAGQNQAQIEQCAQQFQQNVQQQSGN